MNGRDLLSDAPDIFLFWWNEKTNYFDTKLSLWWGWLNTVTGDEMGIYIIKLKVAISNSSIALSHSLINKW